jgi:hypothetical protein
LLGVTSRAQHQEHHQLRQPGRRILHAEHVGEGADRAIADHQPGQVDREEARAAQQVGEGEHRHRAGHGQQRMQSGRQVQAVQGLRDEHSPERAGDATDAELLGEAQQHLGHALGAARRQPTAEHEGEEDRERIVAAGLDFQRCRHPSLQVQSVGAQQEEHGGGIGAGHHRAQQQSLQPGEAEQPDPGEGCDRGGEHDPDRGQGQGRRERSAHVRDAGAQAAVEQDDGQRERTDAVGQAHVVEGQADRSILAHQHAEHQEHQQHGRAEARGDQTGSDAGQHQHGAAQQQPVAGV